MENQQQRNKHWLALDKKWFEKNQSILLWLLNTPVIKIWFRWVMSIHTFDCPLNKDIEEISPSSYTIDAGLRPYKLSQVYETISKDPARNRQMRRHAVSMLSKIKRGIIKDDTKLLPSKTTDFRTHLKYAKRLYFAFKPMWWAMHTWDEIFADRFVPQYGFGFATLTAYPDPSPETSTVDGYVVNNRTTWAAARSNTDGTDVNDSIEQGVLVQDRKIDASTWIVNVAFFLFDTSALTGSATISDAVFSVKPHDSGGSITDGIDVRIVSSSPASNTAITTADFDQVGSTVFASLAGWTDTDPTYRDFTMDANGRANVSKTGVSKFGARGSRAMDNLEPTGNNQVLCKYADTSGTTSDPKIVITYTTATNVTVEATTQAATFSIPTYATLQGIALSASTQAATFSIPTYDTIQGLTVTPDTQFATFSIPVYDVLTPDIMVTPTTQSATFSIPTYSALFDFAFGVSAQAATFSIPTYAIALGQTILPVTQSATFSIPTYSIGLGSIIEAATQEATFSMPAYDAFGETRTIATVQVATFSIPAYSVLFDMVISPDTQVATFSLPALYKIGAVWTKRARQTNSTWSRTSRNSN